MRIAIDVEHAYHNLTGTGIYLSELVKQLARVDESNDYTLFTSSTYSDAPDMDLRGNKRFRRRSLELSHKMCMGMWLALNWPPVNRYIGDHDLYHCMTISPFPARGGKYLMTVHDLAWLVMPELYKPRHRYEWSVHQRRMLRRADHYVAVSEWTKRDMVEYLRIPSERITVIPEGARERFRPVDPSQVKTTLSKYGLDAPYFLTVGDMNPRKNHLRLVRAFAAVLKRSSEPVSLVFCGSLGHRGNRVVQEVQRLELTDSVRFLGRLADEDLVGLMNGARALVFASLYEGFGLPILEAMACGTPVITSNVTSMPEVAGDAALLVDPTSEIEIVEAMWQALSEPKVRDDLVERGRKRATMFTWERTARQCLELYQSMC